MSKTYRISPKAKHGHSMRTLSCYINGKLTTSTRHREGIDLSLSEEVVKAIGYTKEDYVKPTSSLLTEEGEDDND